MANPMTTSPDQANMTGHFSIEGHQADLPDKRKVFIGRLKGKEALFIRFENDGDVTKLSLSPEAYEALVSMHNKLVNGDEVTHVYKEPRKFQWILRQQP